MDAGGPSRVASRRKPIIDGWRAASRNIARTMASTRSNPGAARATARSSRTVTSAAVRSMAASSNASLDGYQ